MKWLSFVIVFISCSKSFGHSCIVTENGMPLNESLQNFNRHQFKTKLDNLMLKTNNDNDSPCRVLLYINYINEELIIGFTENVKDDELDAQETQLDTWIEGTQFGNITIKHYLKHGCSTDRCEINFINRYIQWLLSANYPKLSNNQLASLFSGNNTAPGQCFNNTNLPDECSTGHCIAFTLLLENGLSITVQDCDDKVERQYAKLQFTTKIYSNGDFPIIGFDFRCTYNQCNNKRINAGVLSIFIEVYDPESVIMMLLKRDENEVENQNMTSHSMPSSTSTNIQEETNSSTNTTSTITLQTKLYTTTQSNTGYHIESDHHIIYGTLVIFIFHLNFLA